MKKQEIEESVGDCQCGNELKIIQSSIWFKDSANKLVRLVIAKCYKCKLVHYIRDIGGPKVEEKKVLVDDRRKFFGK